MRRLIRILGLCVALVASPALGDALDDAKAAGKLGEGPDGFLHVVDQKSTELIALADDINTKRREKYLEIAKNQGVPLDAVAAAAGSKLVERTPPGEFVMRADGSWVRK